MLKRHGTRALESAFELSLVFQSGTGNSLETRDIRVDSRNAHRRRRAEGRWAVTTTAASPRSRLCSPRTSSRRAPPTATTASRACPAEGLHDDRAESTSSRETHVSLSLFPRERERGPTLLAPRRLRAGTARRRRPRALPRNGLWRTETTLAPRAKTRRKKIAPKVDFVREKKRRRPSPTRSSALFRRVSSNDSKVD